MLHILHHVDLDGYAAANFFLLRQEREAAAKEVRCHGVNYDKPIPLDQIGPDDEVALVDFTPPHDVFKALLEKVGVDDVVWIDHHQTNIDKVADLPAPRGLRADTIPAACTLAFNWCRPRGKAPRALQLIEAWDTWTHGGNPEVLDFVWGAKHLGLETNLQHPMWRQLLGFDEATAEKALAEVTKHGGVVRSFDIQQMTTRLKSHGFEVRVPTRTVEGGLRGMALNCGYVNSFSFSAYEGLGFDVWVSFYFNGTQYTVSFYRAKDGKLVHLGQLAATMGGGGHEGAAGFQCKELPEWLRCS